MMLSMRVKRSVWFYVLATLQVLVAAQSCYYPNGDLSTTDAPCSSEEGAACCPLNWQCLDNGLCYLDNEKYYGRYTCTDKSWQSSACPAFCTDSMNPLPHPMLSNKIQCSQFEQTTPILAIKPFNNAAIMAANTAATTTVTSTTSAATRPTTASSSPYRAGSPQHQ